MDHYTGGVVTSGSYFTYKGVRYGMYTQVLFTDEFYKKMNEVLVHNSAARCGWKYPYFRTFNSIVMKDGQKVWRFGEHLISHEYIDDNIDIERDIEKIITPVYYMEPKELVKKRIKNGSWINYILPQTLFYIACLIISLLLKEWYLIWTIGLYIYLRTSYITLSKGELNRGW